MHGPHNAVATSTHSAASEVLSAYISLTTLMATSLHVLASDITQRPAISSLQWTLSPLSPLHHAVSITVSKSGEDGRGIGFLHAFGTSLADLRSEACVVAEVTLIISIPSTVECLYMLARACAWRGVEDVVGLVVSSIES